MSKKKIEKMQKEYSKPQLSRWQRQHRLQKYVFFSGIGIIIAVLLFVSVGWYFTQYVPLNAAVIKVNNTSIKMIDYIRLLRNTLKSATSDTDISSVANDVLNYLAQIEVVRQGAAKLNITVSNDEIKQLVKQSGESWDWSPIAKMQLLQGKLNDNYIKAQLPTTADQRDILAIFLESEAQAIEIRNQITTLPEDEQTAKFKELAASELSLNAYTKGISGAVGMHVQQIFNLIIGSSVPADYAFASEKGAFSQPRPDTASTKTIGYWLIQVIEKGTNDNEGKVHVQAMLLGSLDEALQVKARLADGQDFATLAKELSQYSGAKDNGGDLGFIASGTMSTVFDGAAFSQEVGVVSEPVKDTDQTTTGGYWLIKVMDAATDTDVPQDDADYLAYQTYNEWYNTEQNGATITDVITTEQFSWAINKAQ